ncbi:MAG: 4-alpha-glucanotransferase, partial [Bacilli bacterium]
LFTSEQCLLYKVSYNGETLEQLVRTIVALCYASPSFLSVLPIQDLLIKDNSCRMNHPSTLGSNWTYRTLASDFTTELAKNISSLVTEYKRN